ncbi:methionine adenosyltransferase [Rossellomorea vietnamensis]|uniref:Methionine adenosyltransferase n=1 Tax=Rossellomorea vietnamensis TaxID=218284 RepID=A0A6I6ULA5_9BACI|nr:methionine adenosyltransferase [Rossellomorea vietnamensis]QHE59801.1 methionine adenosyltransferase [Rossellomorea vietnamensis]
MKLDLYVDYQDKIEKEYEIVERKGKGHPDTLADALGEQLSIYYSKYTKERYGAILHHNFDKVGIMGGQAKIEFGSGNLTQPIRILLNGRASSRFGNELIPVKELLINETRSFFKKRYPMLEVEKDLKILYEVSDGSSPGAVDSSEGTRHYWFSPRDLNDLSELKFLANNDTSMGCGFAPYSTLESIIIEVEGMLNSQEYKLNKPWLGNDIKIMGVRFNKDIRITMCIPQICLHVANLEEYKNNIEGVRKDILRIFSEYKDYNFELFINTRDKYDSVELYLTFTGSSIETGDEGFVGRGNRIGGVIAPFRTYTMEGISGKNPVYHTGKMYCVVATDIASDIYRTTGHKCEVVLIGQSGQSLSKPWKTLIKFEGDESYKESIHEIAHNRLEKISECTDKIMENGYILA